MNTLKIVCNIEKKNSLLEKTEIEIETEKHHNNCLSVTLYIKTLYIIKIISLKINLYINYSSILSN